MSWLPRNNFSGVFGWLLQCDACGYIRGSAYKADRDMPLTNHKRLFRVAKTPDAWSFEKSTDSHLCPHCVRRTV